MASLKEILFIHIKIYSFLFTDIVDDFLLLLRMIFFHSKAGSKLFNYFMQFIFNLAFTSKSHRLSIFVSLSTTTNNYMYHSKVLL